MPSKLDDALSMCGVLLFPIADNFYKIKVRSGYCVKVEPQLNFNDPATENKKGMWSKTTFLFFEIYK